MKSYLSGMMPPLFDDLKNFIREKLDLTSISFILMCDNFAVYNYSEDPYHNSLKGEWIEKNTLT